MQEEEKGNVLDEVGRFDLLHESVALLHLALVVGERVVDVCERVCLGVRVVGRRFVQIEAHRLAESDAESMLAFALHTRTTSTTSQKSLRALSVTRQSQSHTRGGMHARTQGYVQSIRLPYLALETPRDEPLEARERAGRDEQDVARVHWDRVAHRARALAARPAHRALRHEHLRALQHLQQRLLHTFAAHVAHLLYNTSVLHFTLNFSCNSTIRNTVLRVISLKLRTKNLEIFCKLIFV